MSLISIVKKPVPVSIENGEINWCIDHFIGDRDAALETNRGELVIFNTVDEAQNYIDDE